MLTAIILQAFGLMYLVLGLTILVHPAQFQKSLKAMGKSNSGHLFFGVLMVLLGALIIVLHSYWSTPEEIFVSCLGWAALLKGMVYFGFPDLVEVSTKYFLKTVKSIRFVGVLIALLGAGLYLAAVI